MAICLLWDWCAAHWSLLYLPLISITRYNWDTWENGNIFAFSKNTGASSSNHFHIFSHCTPTADFPFVDDFYNLCNLVSGMCI